MDGFGIPGKWMASFRLNGRDLTNIYGFESFKLVEEAGNQLPTFSLTFRSPDTGLLSYLNEGNVITAGLGVAGIEMSGIPLRVMSKKVSRADSANLRFTVTGFYDAIGYVNNSKTEISQKMSAIDRMKQVVSKYFKLDFGSNSNDSMSWIQHGIPDKDMVQQLWTRADFGNSNFPMIGISSDGLFRMKTISDLLGSGYQWNFTNSLPMDGNKIVPFHYDYEIESDTGFSNYYQAYSRTSDIIKLDEGIGNLFNSTVGNFLGQSSTLEQSASILSKIAGSVVSSENNHENFHQAHNDNTANLASASSTKLFINNTDLFFPIKTLDVMMFTDFLEGEGNSISSFSGLWIVTDVTRHIENNKFYTLITAVRESMNNVMMNN